MRKVVLIAVSGLLITGIAAFALFQAFPVQIGMKLAERTIEARMSANVISDLPDGLHVGICGSGSPLPDPTRAGPCVLVMAGPRIFVVDSGSGSTRNLSMMGVPLGDTEAVLLTHYHSDHISDLGELLLQRWVGAANDSPVAIYGPVGVARVVDGVRDTFALDATYRTAHHGAAIAPPSGFGGEAHEIALGEAANASAIVIDDADLRVTMFRVSHDPIDPAVGYRFDYKGRSVVISGDTSFDPSLIEHAAGADLLLHEALQPKLVRLITESARAAGRENIAIITEDILNYHASPEEAARVASEAEVDALVLYHIVPPLPSPLLYPAFLGDAGNEFSGDITVGEDRMFFSLPVDQPDVINASQF